MQNFIILISLLLSFSGCGGAYTVDGNITVTHTIEITDEIQRLLIMACGYDLQCQQDLLTTILENISAPDTGNQDELTLDS